MKQPQTMSSRRRMDPQAVLAQGYLGLLLTCFLLYPGFRGYEQIGEAKKHAAAILTGGYVVLSLLLQLELLLTGQRKLPSMTGLFQKIGPVRGLILAFLVFSCLAALLSDFDAWHGVSRGEGLWTILLFVLSFLLLSVYGQLLPWMVHGFGISMTLCALVALLQLMGYNPLHLFPGDLTYYDSEIAYHGAYLGTIGNADLTAGMLSLAIPVFGVTLWKGEDRRRFWLVLPLALCLAVLLWSGIASGLAALAVGTLVCMPVLLPEKRQRKFAWIGAGILALLALLLFYLWDPGSGTLHELHCVLHRQWDDSFGSYRIYIWKQVLALSKEHLLFGIGPDTLAALELDGFYEFNAAGQMTAWTRIDLAHNEYLQILISQGLFALLAYLGALGLTFRHWVRRAHCNLRLAICGSAVIWYSVQVFFGFSLCPTAPIFWAFWALADREAIEERKRTE